MNKGDTLFMYCELLFKCREDKIIFKNFKNYEKILEVVIVSINEIKPVR